MAGEHEWTKPLGEWVQMGGLDPINTIECLGGGNDGGLGGGSAFRKELDYERNAHRKTTELLIEKDRELQRAKEAVEEYGLLIAHDRRDLDVVKAEREVWREQYKLERKARMHEWAQAMGAKDVIELCIPIVRDLFAATNSAKEHAACQAALAAYEELTHASVASQPAPDPVDVGLPQPRHVSDCQQERVGGMGGGQLPGPAGRTQDGAAYGRATAGPDVKAANHTAAAYFHGILSCSGYTTAYLEWDYTGPWPNRCVGDFGKVGRVTFDAKRKVGTKQECLDCASALADELRARKQCVLWRRQPEMSCQHDFHTGKVEWSFYCRYAAVQEDIFKKIVKMDFSLLRE